jgi:hypothetical protein
MMKMIVRGLGVAAWVATIGAIIPLLTACGNTKDFEDCRFTKSANSNASPNIPQPMVCFHVVKSSNNGITDLEEVEVSYRSPVNTEVCGVFTVNNPDKSPAETSVDLVYSQRGTTQGPNLPTGENLCIGGRFPPKSNTVFVGARNLSLSLDESICAQFTGDLSSENDGHGACVNVGQ